MATEPVRRTPAIWLYAAPALAALAVLIIAAMMFAGRTTPASPTAETTANDSWLAAQTSSEGPVTVQATPALTDDGLVFEIVLDTHSVDLDSLDLTQLAVLRIDEGQAMVPSAWTAPAGGHHRQGTLTFAAAETSSVVSARSIELIIRDVGGVPERSFQWTR
jgi:hypothetical protein